MKILNLYAGIGGNRKLWGDEHEITSVELDENICKMYSDIFTNDIVICDDAHKYLLEILKNLILFEQSALPNTQQNEFFIKK